MFSHTLDGRESTSLLHGETTQFGNYPLYTYEAWLCIHAITIHFVCSPFNNLKVLTGAMPNKAQSESSSGIEDILSIVARYEGK